MPLPANSSLSLQGQLRPGTKPKLAMVVRMTEEALDTLQQLDASEQMEFEFGEHPGIHIRTSFFPLNLQTSPGDSELYIRTTTHARPSAPLKLSAALAGRIRVERTSTNIPDEVVKRVVNASAAVVQEKERRKIKVIDKPPVPVKPTTVTSVKTAAKNNKTGSPKGTPAVGTTHSRVSSNHAAAASPEGAPSAPITSLSNEEETALRTRLIHFLALGSQPFSIINKEAGGDEDLTGRILHDIANQEPLPKNSTVQQQDQPWRLKARSWLSVRPYTYPTYSEPERVAVMRSARVWFKNMKVQESDPVWEHVRYRAAVSAPAASLKERKQGKRDGDLKMKSEVGMSSSSSTYASALHARSGAGNSPPEPGQIKASLKVPDGDGEREEGELSASSTPPPRAVPGASASVPVGRIPPGSKLPLQHKQHVFLPSRPMTPPMVGHSNVAPTGASSLPGSTTGVKRSNGPVDVRAIRRPPPPEQSERARPAPPIPPPLPPSDKKTAVRRDALSTPPSQQKGTVSKDKDSNRDRQRAKEESKLERERDRAKRERERDAKQQEREVAKEKEKERGKAALAQQARRLAASTPPIPAASSTSSSLVSKKRVRAEVSPSLSDHDDDSSDFDLTALRMEKRRKKAKLRESGAGAAASGKADASLKSTKLDRAHERERDASSTPRFASPAPRKVKRDERSPIPPPSQEYLSSSQARSSSAVASSSRAVSSNKVARTSEAARSSSAKIRRRSPKFTSDEEEGEEHRPLKVSSASRSGKVKKEAGTEKSGSTSLKASYLHPSSVGSARPTPSPRPSHALPHKPPPPASAPVTSSSSKVNRKSRSPIPRRERPRSRSRSPVYRRSLELDDMDVDIHPLPSASEHESLRERYANTYAAYIEAFQKVVAQKNKITRLLQSRTSTSGSASVSESEADMMSPEEIEKLSREHHRLHGELESIRSLYAQ